MKHAILVQGTQPEEMPLDITLHTDAKNALKRVEFLDAKGIWFDAFEVEIYEDEPEMGGTRIILGEYLTLDDLRRKAQ